MKIFALLATAALALTLSASAAEKKSAAKKSSPPPDAPAAEAPASGEFSEYKTADEFWAHVEALRQEPTEKPASQEEFLKMAKTWFGSQKKAAEAFLQRYPKDPRHYDAQMISIQATMQLARFPGADPGPPNEAAEQQKTIDTILSAPDASDDVKGEATFVRAIDLTENLDTDHPETISTFLKTADDFLTKYGKHRLAPQMREVQLQVVSQVETPEAAATLDKIAHGDDPRIAEGARQVLTQRQKMKDLKTKPIDLKFTATDGHELNLESLRGKVVLVDFWASWCGPCMAEAPNVVATYQKLHEKGFEIVGISLDQEKDAMDAAIKKQGMTWRQYFDGKGWKNEIASSFGIRSIPAAWLIDKKGFLRETSLRGEDLGAGVEKLLAE